MVHRAGFVGRMGPPTGGLRETSVLRLGMTTLPSYVTFTRASVANYFDSTGTLTSAATDVPRFDFDPATARTNLCLQSEDLANAAWTPAGATITSNTEQNPFGSSVTADLYTEALGSAGILNTTAITVATSTVYTFSIYLERGNFDWVRLRIGDTGSLTNGVSAWFNLSTIATGSTANIGTGWTAGTTSITNIGGGWVRVAAAFTTGATTLRVGFSSASADASNTRVNVGSGTGIGGTLTAWGAMVNIGSTAQAYVATTSAAATACDPRGLLIEGARTNISLWNRDLTNAAWVKTNVTAALDQTGLDRAANTASSITATAANGTVLQTVTLASSARFMSAYVRRLVGTGTIEMTTDNGTTWTPVTVTSTTWTRVTIPSQTVTNPVFGFRIATSGDSIAVDFVQNEDGAFATSPISTTTAAATRAVDNARILELNSIRYNQTEGTMYGEAEFVSGNTGFERRIWQVDDNTDNNRHTTAATAANSMIGFTAVGGATQSTQTSGATTTINKVAYAYKVNDFSVSGNGAAVSTDTNGLIPTVDRARIGASTGGSRANGWIRNITYYPTRLSNAELQSRTA
jgi:hypothetical protein